MEIFTQKEFELFKVIAGLSQTALKKSMTLFLKKHYNNKKVVFTPNYVYAKGNIPICLVAHLDTVHSKPVKDLYFDRAQDVLWSPQGIGADDRAGVFAIISIINDGFRPHIIFTTDEEKGCIGSMKLALRGNPFKNLKYIIQIDRRGSKDSVFYDCNNSEFEEYINKFGFKTNYGSFSDITELCPEWEVAGVNLSSGYYNEHSLSEYLKSKELKTTISKIKKMLSQKNIPSFEYIPGNDNNWLEYLYNNNNNFAQGILNSTNTKRTCGCCNKITPINEMIPVIQKEKYAKYYCGECLGTKVNWCVNCGEPYDLKDGTSNLLNKLCPICEDTMNKSLD